MFDLNRKIEEFKKKGFVVEVNAACKYAQRETRTYIARTHPHTAFGGKTLNDKQFVAGMFDVQTDKVVSSLYAAYFARWYNTGAFGGIIRYGKYRGRRATKYPARGDYFENNARAIEEYFAARVEEYLERRVDQWLQQK